MNKGIHIVFGESPAGIIKRVIRPDKGNLLVNVDPISCGPIAELNDLERWKSIRKNFISSIYSDDPDFQYFEYKHDILLNLEKIKRSQEVYLWIGSGLAEQLLFVWIIQLFKLISADLDKLNVIQFHQAPNKNFEVVSVGLLNPEQLSNHPTPKKMSKDEIEYLAKVWNVISGSDPISLLSLLEEKGPLPLLNHSLSYLLGRFPDYKNGLTFWDNELLKYAVKKGPKATRIIGHTIGYSFENLDWLGDQYLYYRLRKMGNSSLKQPIVELKGRSSRMQDTDVYLTEVGQRVLSGQLNHVELNGVDEWVCGIHLNSDSGNVWYHNGGSLIKR